MKDQNRVLVRTGARSLSAEEMERVGGGIHTETLCTVPTETCPTRMETLPSASADLIAEQSGALPAPPFFKPGASSPLVGGWAKPFCKGFGLATWTQNDERRNKHE
jgi:hypothetical protein